VTLFCTSVVDHQMCQDTVRCVTSHTIDIQPLLKLCQEGGWVLSLHLVHSKLLLQVRHKAPQKSYKVFCSSDVAGHLTSANQLVKW